MARVKSNFSMSAETQWEFNRLHKILGRSFGFESQAESIEFLVHYAGAIINKTADRSLLDAATRRQAEAKIEHRGSKRG